MPPKKAHSPKTTPVTTAPNTTETKTTDLGVVVKRRGRAPVDPNETKDQKLRRLGEKRVSQALHKVKLIGNLAAYKPTDPQIDAIMTALGESCARLEARLRGTRQESYTFRMM